MTLPGYVQSPERLTALVGVHDLIVVDTPDAVLVAHKEIKNLLLGGNPKALEAAVKEFNDLLQASNMHT